MQECSRSQNRLFTRAKTDYQIASYGLMNIGSESAFSKAQVLG
jgi:hypothetical protein